MMNPVASKFGHGIVLEGGGGWSTSKNPLAETVWDFGAFAGMREWDDSNSSRSISSWFRGGQGKRKLQVDSR